MKLTAIITGNNGIDKYHRYVDNDGIAHIFQEKQDGREWDIHPAQALKLEQHYLEQAIYQPAIQYVRSLGLSLY